MAYRVGFLIVLFTIISNNLFSQSREVLKDTLKEVIIYEYDTVYLNPDTIRIIDTIFDVNKKIKKKPRKNNYKFVTKTLFNKSSFLSFLTPNFLSISVSPGINFNKTKYTPDSLTNETGINNQYFIQWNYRYKKYLLSAGFGYSPYREKLKKTSFSYSNSLVSYSNPYDSLLITRLYSYNYYYQYINTVLMLGREWNIGQRVTLSLNIGVMGDLLVSYKQGNTYISKNSVRKWGISGYIAPKLNYRIDNFFEVFLSPNYRYLFTNKPSPPYTYYQKYGMGFGLNVILK